MGPDPSPPWTGPESRLPARPLFGGPSREEPELGLHPLVAELLVAASERTQVIVTTHSDALVSALTDHVDSVFVCEHRGGTELVNLDPHRLQHWLDRYRLGDLWRMGELGSVQ